MNENTQLATSFLEAMAADGLPAAIAKYGAADLVFWMAGYGEIQDHAEAAHSAFQSLIVPGSETLKIIGVTAEDSRVAVEAETRAKLRSGKEYFNQYHYLFVTNGGAVSSVRMYYDTALAQATFAETA